MPVIPREVVRLASEEKEVGDYFDWMNRELPLGGIDLPREETRVLFVSRALQLADRLKGVYRHFPRSFRVSLVRASILYRCWSHAHEIQLRTKGNATYDKHLVRAVRATCILKQLDAFRDWYLMEADDGERYIVKLPIGIKSALATDFISTTVARLFTQPVAPVAVVVLGREIARHCAELSRAKFSQHYDEATFALGLRVSASTDGITSGKSAICALGQSSKRAAACALVLDVWTLNSVTDQFVVEYDSLRCQRQLRFVDKSRSFLDSRWDRFITSSESEPIQSHPAAFRITSWQDLEPWLRRIDDFPHRRLWDICMQMPPSRYDREKSVLANVLSKLFHRGFKMRSLMWRLHKEGYFPRFKETKKNAHQ